MMLNWNQETEQDIDVERFIPWLEQLLHIAATKEKVEGGEVSLTFTDDTIIQQLNKQYRGIDQATDVLSFALEDADDDEMSIPIDASMPKLLGDIVISVETAIRQSEQYNHSLEREIGFLFVHGFLHLLGYDHEDDEAEREMFRIQEEVLLEAGLER